MRGGWQKPSLWLLVSLGILVGTGLLTFFHANGLSYFSSDPKACVNCHIMRDQYESWHKSSHHAAATCVQCHLPHSLLPKLLAKAENGYHHSKAFTLQDFHEPIRIGRKNAAILQQSCLECHSDLVHDISGPHGASSEAPRCVHCHQDVGHGPSR